MESMSFEKIRIRFSLTLLICVVTAICVLLNTLVLRRQLSSLRSELAQVYNDFAGFEDLQDGPQFNVSQYGGSNSKDGSSCGCFSLAVSDFKQFRLLVECFDGTTEKLTSKEVPLEGRQVFLSMAPHYSIDGKPTHWVFTFQGTERRWGSNFFVPYNTKFHRNVRKSKGRIHEDAILAVAFFEEKGRHKFPKFPYSKVSDLSIERLHKLAIDERIRIAYCRFERRGESVDGKSKGTQLID